MGEFDWVYIDKDAYMSASGPTGSIQFRTGDETIDGFRYTTCSVCYYFPSIQVDMCN